MNEFLNMGGDAFFVWTSYFVVFIVLLLNYYLPRIRQRQLLRQIHMMLQPKRTAHKRDHNNTA